MFPHIVRHHWRFSVEEFCGFYERCRRAIVTEKRSQPKVSFLKFLEIKCMKTKALEECYTKRIFECSKFLRTLSFISCRNFDSNAMFYTVTRGKANLCYARSGTFCLLLQGADRKKGYSKIITNITLILPKCFP